MSDVERMTITLTTEMAKVVRGAVRAGEYASSSEIIREALRDWKYKKVVQDCQLEELRAEIQDGLSDVKAGRMKKFDAERIVKKGKKRLAKNGASR